MYRSSFTLINQEAFALDAKWNGFMVSYMGLISVLVQGLLVKQLTRRFSEDSLIQVFLLGLGISLAGCAMAFSVASLAIVLIPLVLSQGVIKTCVLSVTTKVHPPLSKCLNGLERKGEGDSWFIQHFSNFFNTLHRKHQRVRQGR